MSDDNNCFVVSDDNYDSPQYVLVVGASISYVCYFYILYLRYVTNTPALSRHPTELSVYKVWFELFFVSQFFWLAFVPRRDFWAEEGESCKAASKFAVFCFICQFSLLGAELWFFVMSRDMFLTISNPFSSYKKAASYFSVTVFTCATIFGCVLVARGPGVYGLSSDPMIWIQDTNDSNQHNQSSVNWNKFYFFYLWMTLIYAYSFYVLWFVNDRIRTGIEETLQARMNYIRRARIYTIGYSLFWTVVFVLEFVDFIGALKEYSRPRTSVRTTIAFVLASRGMWSLAILVIGNYTDLKLLYVARLYISSEKLVQALASQTAKENQDTYVMSPHLNEALRTEVLLYTTQGIRTAVFQNQLSRETGKRSIGVMNHNFKFRNSALSSMELEEGVFSFSFDEILPGNIDDDGRSLTEVGPLSEVSVKSKASANAARGGDLNVALMSAVDSAEPVAKSKSNATLTEVSIPFGETDPRRELSPSALEQLSLKGFDPLKPFRPRKLRSDFYFKDYASGSFHKIRQLSNINDEEFIQAFKGTTGESFSEGRSGAFMFMSADEKYIVKTCSAHEVYKLLCMLPQYVEYLSSHPHTLLTRYMSAHAIVMYDTTLYFVVMLNFFPNIVLSERYDLKGSWVDRNGTRAGMTRTERHEGGAGVAATNVTHNVPLYKDNDLTDRIILRPEAAISLALTIRDDVLFLRSNGLMDYSLLIGVRRKRFEVVDRDRLSSITDENVDNMTEVNPFRQDQDGGIHAGVVEGPGGYYFGIIDTLQEWTWRKRVETSFKVYIRMKEKNGISSVEPLEYATRFWNRVVRDVFEYVEEKLDGDIDSEPRVQVRTNSARMRAPSIKFSANSTNNTNSSGNSSNNNDHSNASGHTDSKGNSVRPSDSEDESVNFERDTDRRFSVIPLDFDNFVLPGTSVGTGTGGTTPGTGGQASSLRRTLHGRPSQITRPSIVSAASSSVPTQDRATASTASTLQSPYAPPPVTSGPGSGASNVDTMSYMGSTPSTSVASITSSTINNPLLRPSDVESTIV